MTTAVAIEVHPLAELIPPMTEAEYEELKADIAENGLSQSITLYEGKVLDGRHRARACGEVGVEPHFTEYEGDTPAQYVITLNVKRRSLTTSQRAAVAVDSLPVLEEEARKRQAHGETAPGRRFQSNDSERKNSRSYQEAGELVGVGEATVGRAKRVLRDDPEAFERIRSGETTVNTALSEVVAKQKYGKRKVAHAHQVVGQIVSRFTNATLVMSQTDFNAAVEAITEEEATKWAQQLRTARTELSRLISVLETTRAQ